jgi:hypothetical protein
MRCTSCSTTLPAGAGFCPECGAPAPDPTAPRPVNPLDVIPPIVGIPVEAVIVAPNYEARPPSHLTATDWTYPLQVTAAAWLVTSAVVGVITGLQAEDRIRSAVYPSSSVRQLQMSGDDALRYTQLVFDAFLLFVLVFALVKLVVALSAYRARTTWAFYAVLALTAIDSLLALVSLVNLVIDVLDGRPLGATLVMLVMRLSAAGICGWTILALRRYGRAWALRMKPRGSA